MSIIGYMIMDYIILANNIYIYPTIYGYYHMIYGSVDI